MGNIRISFEPSRDLYPFRSRWFENEIGRTHYIDEGTGPPILFCHGNPTWSFLYRDIIRRLRDRFRCVAVDYFGFGLSDRPEGYGYSPGEHAKVISELVGRLDLQELVIMGQDWGGPIGLAVGLSEPERIRGFVFGNTWFWPADRLRLKLFSRVMSSGPMQRAILNRNFFVEKLIPSGTSRQLTPSEMRHYRGVQPTPEARVGVAEFPRQIIEAGPWLGEIAEGVESSLSEKPLLLVWGMRDLAFGRAFIPRWQQTFPDHRLVTLSGAKHYIQEDAPVEIARAIAERFPPDGAPSR
jgi:haloalkane dehalogenase